MIFGHFDYKDGEQPEYETVVTPPAKQSIFCSCCGRLIGPEATDKQGRHFEWMQWPIEDGMGGYWCLDCVPF